MTRPTRPDDDLDDFGPDLDALTARYQADSGDIEPPHHLDAQLLAAAHRAADARPRAPSSAPSGSRSLMRRMRAPFGLAATIVAVASVTVVLWKESPEKLVIPSDHAPLAASPTASIALPPKNPDAPVVAVQPDRPAASSPARRDAAPAQSVTPAAAPVAQAAKQEPFARQRSHSPAEAVAAAAGSGTALGGSTRSSEAKAASDASELHKPPVPKPEQSLEGVTVTGSNLRRADTETPSPVQSIDLQEEAPATIPATRSAPAASAPAPVAPPPAPPLAAATAPPAPDVVAAAPPAVLDATSPAPAGATSIPPNAPVPAPVPVPAPAPPPPAPARAFASPPAASLEVPRPKAIPAEASLLAALQTAADAGDTRAANLVLETLQKNFPQTQIPPRLRVELTHLGISLPNMP